MVLKSTCPLQASKSWDGKIVGHQVWKSGFTRREDEIWKIPPLNMNRTLLSREESSHPGIARNITRNRMSTKRQVEYKANPLILWGSHHKTGTYQCQKMFSIICARLRWCCMLHATRESTNALRRELSPSSAFVQMIGHAQWIWEPQEILPLMSTDDHRDYRFIHFYRHPHRKIISALQYHKDGAEIWCKKAVSYNQSCRFKTKNNDSLSKLLFTEADVFHYCSAFPICKHCCISEHSYSLPYESRLIYRSLKEYSSLCHILKDVNNTLKNYLQHNSLIRNLRVEAALNFYESFRMARIMMSTWNDSRTLHVDLDQFMSNYDLFIKIILKHMGIKLNIFDTEALVQVS